jgi:hypothetical protein
MSHACESRRSFSSLLTLSWPLSHLVLPVRRYPPQLTAVRFLHGVPVFLLDDARELQLQRRLMAVGGLSAR